MKKKKWHPEIKYKVELDEVPEMEFNIEEKPELKAKKIITIDKNGTRKTRGGSTNTRLF